MDHLDNSHSKVVVITGAAMGIGACLASLLAADGHRVVIGDIADEVGHPLAESLSRAGGQAYYVHADISRASDAENLIDQAVNRFGGLDWLVNNAGVVSPRSVMAVSEEEWDRVLGINLKGAWLCTKFAIPHLAMRQGAAIVNVASNAGLVGFRDLAAYCASKGGLIQLTKAAALDCAPLGIRVNAVAPGHTRTPMGMGFINAQPDPAAFEVEHVNKRHPIGRMSEPEEVAEAVYFLLTEKASYITGAVLSVDGGYTTQ